MNDDIEQGIIAVLLKNPKDVELVNLNPEWFTDSNCRALYMAMKEANDPSLMTVFGKAKTIFEQMTLSYSDVIALRSSAITDAHIGEMVKDLHRVYAEGQLDQVIQMYQEAPYDDNLEKLSVAINNVNSIDEHVDDGSIGAEAEELRYNLEHPVQSGIKSYPQLDTCLAGGFYGGMLFTLGARPGVGKTAYSVNLAAQMMAKDSKLHVDYFTLEMTKREMLNRFISRDTGVPSTALRANANELSSTIKQVVKQSSEKMERLNLAVYDQAKTLAQIASVIRRHASEAKQNEYVAFVDYIGLITVPGFKERYLQVGEITRQLKVMANEYNVPIVALTQLNRGIESRQDKSPQLSDIRESGSVEQDSNVVAFLSKSTVQDDIIDLAVRKNREGMLMTIPYQFNGQGMKFQELDSSGV
ncbi:MULTISPECIES: replicative DNA helicase [unclassified Levilactobacillus]|uniref:replicative DNA helicase n=1 Tax=unclassified Levilactobacillus TaxID=2767918 RepID=UPI002FF19367